MHQLDVYMVQLSAEFNKGVIRSPESRPFEYLISKARKQRNFNEVNKLIKTRNNSIAIDAKDPNFFLLE